MRGSGAAQMRPRRLFSNQSPPIVGSSAENLRVSDPAWIGGVKVQTVFFFFSRLIAVLAPAAFRYLQSCAFIPPCVASSPVPLASRLIWPPSEGAGRGRDYNKSAY